MISKVVELLRLFNTRTSQLVLGAGAIHSSAKLKSINAKHLALVTQCLGMMIAILPHIRAALMAQLPSKQHLLLSDLDNVKQDYADQLEKVLTKLVTILGGIVEHGLAPLIVKTDFDQRSKTVRDEQGDDGRVVEEGAEKRRGGVRGWRERARASTARPFTSHPSLSPSGPGHQHGQHEARLRDRGGRGAPQGQGERGVERARLGHAFRDDKQGHHGQHASVGEACCGCSGGQNLGGHEGGRH
jgi:hypothetical protein